MISQCQWCHTTTRYDLSTVRNFTDSMRQCTDNGDMLLHLRKGRRRPTCRLYKNKPAGFTQQNHPESLHRAVTHNTDKHNHVSLQPKPPWTTVALSRPHALLFLKVMKRGGQSAAIRAD